MSRYLDPRADVVFKKIFSDNPHLMISFLNAILPLPDDAQIVELKTLSPEQVPDLPIFKRTIADVRCRDAQGRHFIVEMQMEWSNSFRQRLLFSAGQALVKQLKKGEDYHLIQPVYGLGLLAENFDPDPEHWYHYYELVNQAKKIPERIEHLQLLFIELQKFPIKSKAEKQLRILWLRFLREINENTTVVDPVLLSIPEISEAIDLSEQMAYTPGELQTYDSYWDQVSRDKTLLNDALRLGEAKGHAEGVREGIEQGIQQEKEVLAQSLLLDGFDSSKIAKLTGLDLSKIKQIKAALPH